MKRLDHYILKAFIGPFVAILMVVVFVLMLHTLWLYIDELVGKGLGLGVILEFLMWGVLTILPLCLPLATLLSSMMVVGQLAENNELMAIKASGVSFARIITPLMVASLMIAICAYFVGDRVVPKAFNNIYTLRDDIGRTKNEIKIPSGTFYDGIEGYVLRVEEQNKKTGMLYGVMAYDHSDNKGNTSVTIADSAIIRLSRNKDYLTFTLYNGSNYLEDNSLHFADTTLTLQHIDFKQQDLVIALDNYNFEKSDTNRFDDQAKSMSVAELRAQSDSLHYRLDSISKINFENLRLMRVLQMSAQLDTSVDRSGRIYFEDKDFMKWDDLNSKSASYNRAIENAKRFQNEINNLRFEVYEEDYYIRHTDIELLKKFSQALACFILFFIGAPLGAFIRKGGLGTSAIVSVMFFLLYWVFDISGSKLARDGAISAFAGAFISSFVLAPIGAFLSWKAIKDAQLFNMDQIKLWWKRLKSKILRFFRPVRIVYMGTPEFAVAPLDNLIKTKHKIVGVVTVPDKPSGRGLKVNESAVKKYALEHGIPILQPEKLKDPEFLKALEAWKADMFVVVAFRMLPEVVWQMPRLGTFNLHAALLPQYRGAAPINWAVINGEKRTGVTTFMIDKDIDTGGILLREECRINPEDNAGTVHDKLMEIGKDLVVQTVDGLIEGSLEMRVQRSFIQGMERLKPAPKLTRELCHIDWNDTSKHINNLIRGLSPYPAAFTELVSEQNPKPLTLKIYEAEFVSLKGEPGQILSDGKTYFAIATADGALSLKDVQLSGKKRMGIKSFLAGFRTPEEYTTK